MAAMRRQIWLVYGLCDRIDLSRKETREDRDEAECVKTRLEPSKWGDLYQADCAKLRRSELLYNRAWPAPVIEV
jgi:hypothetical protein